MTVLAQPISSSPKGQWSGQGQWPCLPSPLMQKRVCVLVHSSWRTFTMSRLLQPGFRLLRRLRPPVRTLAFSRPTHVGKAAWEFPNSNARDISVTRSCLLYAGWTGNNTCRSHNRQARHLPILGRVCQPLSPVPLHDAYTGSFRQPRSQDWSVNHLRLAVAELLSAGFRPQGLPIPDACCVVLVPSSKNSSFQRAISRAVRGRAPLKRGALRRFSVNDPHPAAFP
jgi:hypothetical protein